MACSELVCLASMQRNLIPEEAFIDLQNSILKVGGFEVDTESRRVDEHGSVKYKIKRIQTIE